MVGRAIDSAVTNAIQDAVSIVVRGGVRFAVVDEIDSAFRIPVRLAVDGAVQDAVNTIEETQ